MRTTKPESGNKFYNTKSNGGYSACIKGSPTDKGCDVLSNCVGYACGRYNEIIGTMKYPYFNCNAENFISRAKSYYPNIEIEYDVTKGRVGDIIVWEGLGSLAGHVAIIEKVNGPSNYYTSESSYGGTAFFNATRTNSNGRLGMSSNYKFLGFIRNEATKEVTPTPTPTKTVDELANEVIAGKWGNGDDRKNRLTNAGYNYSEVQKRVNEILSSEPTPAPKPSVDLLDLVRKTIRGDFGNGNARKEALGSNYEEVQRQVNLNIKAGLTRWDNIKLF